MATLEEHGPLDSGEIIQAVDGPLLYHGQRLDQPTFHELYLRTPKDFRAELIEGVVYVMSSPVHPKHGRPLGIMSGLLYA